MQCSSVSMDLLIPVAQEALTPISSCRPFTPARFNLAPFNPALHTRATTHQGGPQTLGRSLHTNPTAYQGGPQTPRRSLRTKATVAAP